MRSPGSFDLPDHPGRLSRMGGPPEAPERHVEFGAFRPVLTEASGYGDRAMGGWSFRSGTARAGAFTSLSAAFGERLRDRGNGPAGGRTVDAASVPTPRRRMAGKDTDARRTAGYSGARKTEGGEPDAGPVGIPAPRFGYGNHRCLRRLRRTNRISISCAEPV